MWITWIRIASGRDVHWVVRLRRINHICVVRLIVIAVMLALPPVETRAQVVEIEAHEGSGPERAILPSGEPLPEGEEGVRVEVRTVRPGETLRLVVGYDFFSSSIILPSSTAPFSRSILFSGRTPVLTTLCTGDCVLRLRVGADYTFRVPSPNGRESAGDTRTVTITERTIGLEVTHNLRQRTRRRLWLTFATLWVVGGALMGAGARRSDAWCEARECGVHVHAPLFYTGLGLTSIPIMGLSASSLYRGRTDVRVIETHQ